jgi:predicted nucleic acid-binding protein
VIFVDSTVPMYLVGALHPHKRDAERLLQMAISEGRRLVTDAEVFQEILHRYSAIRRLDAVSPAFEALLKVVDEVFAVTLEDAQRAREILLAGATRVSARDALHVAIMERERVTEIMTFDTGFDHAGQVQRVRL